MGLDGVADEEGLSCRRAPTRGRRRASKAASTCRRCGSRTADTWAQWFAEIHDPGPRNWIQSVSTSEVRPPKMVAAIEGRVVLASIHFDNIAEIQRSLELLRTPKWPETGLRAVSTAPRSKQGRALYEEHCARVPHADGPAAQQPRHRLQGAARIRCRDRPDGLPAIRRRRRRSRRGSQTLVRRHSRHAGRRSSQRQVSAGRRRRPTT